MRIHAVFLGLTLLACTDDLTTGEKSSSIVENNRLAANRLAANRLAANRLAANRLAANRLAANRLELNVIDASDLVCTVEGREVLSFIVSCAIADGNVLVATNLQALCGTSAIDDSMEFVGEVGLANDWLNHPVDRTGKGWVSACLFARVNAHNVTVPISLRGNTPVLRADDGEKAAWNLEEGAFYGNYFESLAGHPDQPDWHACRGRDQAAGEIAGLIERDCAEPDPGNPGFTQCGFAYAGDCGDFADHYACKHFDDDRTFYKHCQVDPSYRAKDSVAHGFGQDRNDRNTYGQVITTYVLGL